MYNFEKDWREGVPDLNTETGRVTESCRVSQSELQQLDGGGDWLGCGLIR